MSKLLLTENIQYTIHYYNKKQNPAILCFEIKIYKKRIQDLVK